MSPIEDLTRLTIGDLRARAGTLLSRLREEDRPLVERTLARMAVEQAVLASATLHGTGDVVERAQANLAHLVGTLASVAARYQCDARRESNEFLTAFVVRVVSVALAAVPA